MSSVKKAPYQWARHRGVKELIIEMIEAGESTEDIADELGIGKARVRSMRKELKENKEFGDEKDV